MNHSYYNYLPKLWVAAVLTGYLSWLFILKHPFELTGFIAVLCTISLPLSLMRRNINRPNYVEYPLEHIRLDGNQLWIGELGFHVEQLKPESDGTAHLSLPYNYGANRKMAELSFDAKHLPAVRAYLTTQLTHVRLID